MVIIFSTSYESWALFNEIWESCESFHCPVCPLLSQGADRGLFPRINIWSTQKTSILADFFFNPLNNFIWLHKFTDVGAV